MSQCDHIFSIFKDAGEWLFQLSLVGLKNGNISIRLNDRIYITRKGASLPALKKDDVVSFSLGGHVPEEASSEWPVHLAVYERTAHNAVVHVHPVYATAAAGHIRRFVPVDVEGKYYLKGGVPVVVVSEPAGSGELAVCVADALAYSPCVLVRSHGAFVGGSDVFYCLSIAEILERSAKIFMLEQIIQGVKT